MIAKIGFVVLVFISCGTLYMLDFYLKQDQEENTKQLHTFVQQTRNVALAKTSAREKFEMQLMTDLARCQENAQKTFNNYHNLIQKAAPNKHGEPVISNEVLNEATSLLANEKTDCKKSYDTRLHDGI